MDYAFGRSNRVDPYHAVVIRDALTRNIGPCFADVQDEIEAAFRDNIPMTEGAKTDDIFESLRLTLPQIGLRYLHTILFCKSYAERATGCLSGFLSVSHLSVSTLDTILI